MKKLNAVLFFSGETFYHGLGGISRVTEILADTFESRGVKAFYVTCPKRRDIGREKEFSPRQLFFPGKRFHGIARLKNAKFLEKIIREKGISLIIFQDGAAGDFPLPEVIKKTGVTLFSVSHNQPDCWLKDLLGRHKKERHHILDKWTFPLRIWRHKCRQVRRMRLNYKISDRIILLSEGYRSGHEAFLKDGDNFAKIVAISNPTSFPVQTVDFSEKKNVLLFLGRLENGQKYIDLLLKIWAKIEKNFPNWILKIVGDGSDRSWLENLAGTLNLTKRVEFCGFQKPEKYYREAPIFCMTSFWEGFPMVLNETKAFACVPVVFDSFDSVHDVVKNGETGMLVPAFDLDKYAETLMKLMRERDFRERLARNGQRDVARFLPENIIKKWEELFDEVQSQK